MGKHPKEVNVGAKSLSANVTVGSVGLRLGECVLVSVTQGNDRIVFVGIVCPTTNPKRFELKPVSMPNLPYQPAHA